jgi:hypothetical protein
VRIGIGGHEEKPARILFCSSVTELHTRSQGSSNFRNLLPNTFKCNRSSCAKVSRETQRTRSSSNC